MKRKENNSGSGLKIIPLGGLEQIGMNITAFEYEDSIVVVDCGLSFPADDMLGIDLVIPDVTYLKDNIDKVKGFVITHGHEDHIGALPYVLRDINVPIYATRLTMGIIENKLKEHNLLKTKRKVVKFGQSINMGQFRVEFIKTNHSIVDAAALAIYSPAGTVVHTGDFKVLRSWERRVCLRLCAIPPTRSGLVLRPQSGRWGLLLTGFLRSTKTQGFLWPPLRPMWTGYSRSSTRRINLAVRCVWTAAAW